MAYTMTHILIAEKVLDYIKTPIDYSTYIVGTIAPDAVHASSNYIPELKEKSHFFPERARWGEEAREEEFQKWLESIKNFYVHNYDKYDKDFLLGYVVHVLGDVCSSKQIFAPFLASIKDNAIEKKLKFKDESYVVNYYLFCEYSKERNLQEILREGRCYSIDGVFDKTLFEDRINQLFDFEFRPHGLEHIYEHTICTVENTIKLIAEAPQIIKRVFLDDYYVK